jgi:hypothetical protein
MDKNKSISSKIAIRIYKILFIKKPAENSIVRIYKTLAGIA